MKSNQIRRTLKIQNKMNNSTGFDNRWTLGSKNYGDYDQAGEDNDDMVKM